MSGVVAQIVVWQFIAAVIVVPAVLFTLWFFAAVRFLDWAEKRRGDR